jgi:hypothetical protein
MPAVTTMIRHRAMTVSAQKKANQSITQPIGGVPGAVLRNAARANNVAAIHARAGQTRPCLRVVRNQAPRSTDAASAHITTIMKTAKASRLPERDGFSPRTASCPEGGGVTAMEKRVSLLEKSIRTGTGSPPSSAQNSMSVS